jgi:serine/threonine-protein kinase
VVTALVGVAVWAIVRSDDSSTRNSASQSTTASTSSTKGTTATSKHKTSTASPTPTATAGTLADQQHLMSLLPKGIDLGTCKPVDPRRALARVQCGGSISTGPIAGIFTLFAAQREMDAAFDGTVAGAANVNCPGGGPSPSTWAYPRNPNTPAGRVACSFYKGEPEVTWTRNLDLIMGYVQGGRDLAVLHDWWSQNG